jgi:branched-chain amino acid transport system substrate-binding protein
MKLGKLAALVAAAAIGAAACTGTGGGGTPPADSLGVVTIPKGEKITIGFWGVLSGADASLGVDQRNGVMIAIDDKKGKLLGRDIRIVEQDGLCTPEGGATAAQKLAADKSIVALIGSSCSDETVGGIKTLTEAGMTTISGSNTRPALTDPKRDATYAGFLRTAHSDAFQGKAVAEFVFNQLKLKTAATLHDGSAYAEALVGVFKTEFEKLGGKVAVTEAIAKKQTNMKDALGRIAAGKPEVLYTPIFTAEGGFVVAQAPATAGLEKTILIGSDGMFSADLVKAAGPAAKGMYLSSPNFSAFQAGYADFVKKHEAKFGTKPIQAFHAHAYDAANIIFTAIEKVAITSGDNIYIGRKALRDAIYATKDFKGLTGVLTCGQYGDCGAPLIAVYQVTDREIGGQWPPAAPVWPK